MRNTRLFAAAAAAVLMLLSSLIPLFADGNSTTAPQAKTTVTHQVTVSDKELKNFVGALHDVRKIQIGFQQKVRATVDSSPLSEKRFFQIYNARRAGKSPTPAMSDKENGEYASLLKALRDLQQTSEKSMIKTVQSDGFKVARFNEIAQAIRTDPALRKRVGSIK